MSELALVDQSASIDVGRWAETLVFAVQLAEKVSDTEFVPAALRGRVEAVAATIMYGAEVGVTPMQALAGIHIVDGRPAPSAELMRAMILRAGHTFTIHEMTGTRVRVSGLRRGRPESERVVVEWTVDMARAAGLLGRRNWQNYPRAMLVARATGDLARILFADVVKGLGYVAEESSAAELDEWAITEPPAAPAPRKRALQRRAPRVTQDVAEAPEVAQDAATQPEPPPVAPPAPPRQPRAVPERSDEPRGEVGESEQPPPPAVRTGGGGGPAPPSVDEIAAALAEVRARAEYDDDDVPMPDELNPEAPQDEPPPPGVVPRISAKPLKAVHTMLSRELGTVATRDEKHALLAAIVGHPIESSKDLTRREGMTVLDYMDRFATGDASWQLDLATGAISVTDDRMTEDDDAEQQPQPG